MSERPTFQVACAGIDPRDVRLIEIVLQHAQYNRFGFELLQDLDLTRIDILLANTSEGAGLDAISTLRRYDRPIPVVAAVPRGAQAGSRHSVTIDRLTLQLLPILNRVVEQEGLMSRRLRRAAPSPELTIELTEELNETLTETLNGTPAGTVAQTLTKARTRSSNETVTGQVPTEPSVAETAEIASITDDLARHPLVAMAEARARLLVLIADPSIAAQQQLARALHRMGLDVQCVVSAAAAWQSLARQHFDLLITASGLADSDGFGLIRRLRQTSAYRFTPILLLRNRLRILDTARARIAGDVTLLTRPLTREVLEQVVRTALRQTVMVDDLDELMAVS